MQKSSFEFNELEPIAADMNAFKKTAGFKYFKKAFAEYFQLDAADNIEEKIQWLLSNHSHPLDAQVLLGPVLRLTLKSVLQNSGVHKQMIKESFWRLLKQCIKRFNKDAPAHIKQSPIQIKQWLGELQLGAQHEFHELYYTNIDIITQYLLSPGMGNKYNFLKLHGNLAYEQYVSYQCDLNLGVFVSIDQLEMLCHSFHFNLGVKGHQNLSPKSELSFKPLADVELANESQSHWEILSKNDSRWDFEASSEEQPPSLGHYHSQVQSLFSMGAHPKYIENLQDTLRSEIHQSIIDKKPYEQTVYTVLPSENWSHNGGLEDLVNLIKKSITNEESISVTSKGGIKTKFHSTQGFGQFLEYFRQYYGLDKKLSHKQIIEKMKWLLQSYPHPQEQFMILTPVLRSMLNAAGLTPSELSIQDITQIYDNFNLSLNVYNGSKEEVKISCFNKILSHKPQGVSFGTIEIANLDKSFSPVRKNHIDGFKEKAIILGSKQHAFMTSAKPATSIRSKLKTLQCKLRDTCATGIMYIESQGKDFGKLQASKRKATTKSSNATLISLLEGADSKKLVSFIKQHKININKPISKEPYKGLCSIQGNGHNWNPLHVAVYNGCLNNVQALIEMGANCKAKAQWVVTDRRFISKVKAKKRNVSPLELAASLGQRDTVSLMLNHIDVKKDKSLVQSAYTAACEFGHASVLYSFLKCPGIKHLTSGIENALRQQDLFLTSSLLKHGVTLPKRYQSGDNIVRDSFDVVQSNHNSNHMAFSLALHDFLMISQHDLYKNKAHEITAGLKLTPVSGQVIDTAIQKGMSDWVKKIIQYQASVSQLMQLGKKSIQTINDNIEVLLQPVAQKACVAVTNKNTKLLKTCLAIEDRCLIFHGKYNPMHHALTCNGYEFLRKVYLDYSKSSSVTASKIKEVLAKYENQAYDQYDRSFSFRYKRIQEKKDLDNQLAKASWYQAPKLYGQTIAFKLKQGQLTVADSLHLKAKHNAKVYRNPILKYGSPFFQVLPYLSMITTDSPMQCGLNIAKVLGYRYLPGMAQDWAAPYLPRSAQYAGSLLGHGVSFALMPTYYGCSMLASNGVYYGFKYSGLDKYERLEAFTQLCADQVVYRYSLSNSEKKVFDERYFGRLDRALSESVGPNAASWLAPAVYGLEYSNSIINDVALAPIEAIRPYFSASTFASMQETLGVDGFKFDDLPLSSNLKTISGYAQTAQEYVKTFYQRKQMMEEWAFNCLEESALGQMKDSPFKAERLHAIQSSRTNSIGFDVQITEKSIDENNVALEDARVNLAQATAELEALEISIRSRGYQTELNFEVQAQESKVLKAQVEYDKLQTSLDVSHATLAEQKIAFQEASEKEDALFKETEGFSYHKTWQEKVLASKQGEYDSSLTGAEKEALKQAEQEALSKSIFYNSDATNKSGQAWRAGVDAMFESHKDNFLDVNNIPTTMQGIINYAFDNLRGLGNDRNIMAGHFADAIIRYKYPFYPESGDKAVIEAEREAHFQKITNNLMDNYNKSGGKLRKCRNNIEDYITSEVLGVSVDDLREQGAAFAHKDRKYSFWEHLIMAPANEIIGKITGTPPFPYYTGNGTPPRSGYVGLQFSANTGGNYQVQGTVNGQPVYTFYDSTKKDGWTLTMPPKAVPLHKGQAGTPVLRTTTRQGQNRMNLSQRGGVDSSIAAPAASSSNGFWDLDNNPRLNDLVQDLFQEDTQNIDFQHAVQASMIAKMSSEPPPVREMRRMTRVKDWGNMFWRSLCGEKSAEVQAWKEANTKATPRLAVLTRTLKKNSKAEDMASRALMKGVGYAMMGAYKVINFAAEENWRGVTGETLESVKAYRVLCHFVDKEIARVISREKTETVKKIDEVIASAHSMPKDELLVEVGAIAVSVFAGGAVTKLLKAPRPAVGNKGLKAIDVAEKPSARYQFRNSTVAQRTNIAANELVAPSLLGKYSELMAAKHLPVTVPERSVRASTLAQRSGAATSMKRSGRSLLANFERNSSAPAKRSKIPTINSSRAHVDFSKLNGIVSIEPTLVRFSQSSVSFVKNRVNQTTNKATIYTFQEIVSDMRIRGWVGKPINVVKMPDGALTSIDNTRLLAAREAGIKVKIEIHEFKKAMPDGLARDYATNVDRLPTTWGEAVQHRINDQKHTYFQNRPFSEKFKNGSKYDPRLIVKRNKRKQGLKNG